MDRQSIMDCFHFPEWLLTTSFYWQFLEQLIFIWKAQKLTVWFKRGGYCLAHRNWWDARFGRTKPKQKLKLQSKLCLEESSHCCFCCQHQEIDTFSPGKCTWLIQLPLPAERILHLFCMYVTISYFMSGFSGLRLCVMSIH